jgi:hypothetical protein
MSLPWFEADRPRSFTELTHGTKINQILEKLAEDGLPHIFLYGPSGNGKYTRLLLTLQKIFRNQANPFQMRIRAVNEETGEFCSFPGESKTSTSHRIMMVLTSSCHCVLDLSQPTVRKGLIPFLEMFCRSKNIALKTYKYVIFRHADRLSNELQSALRKMIESYGKNVRFLVTSKSLTGWNSILVSRFLPLRLMAPTRKEASKILKHVSKKHTISFSREIRKSMIEKAKLGGAKTIHLGELLMVAELGEHVITDRKYAVERLMALLETGHREQMRTFLEILYIQQTEDFVDILTGDLVAKLLPTLNHSEAQHRCIQQAAEWDHKIRKDSTPYLLIAAEAFYFSLAELVGR